MQEYNPNLDNDIDLKEIFNILWTAKKLIIQITAIFAIGSVVVSLSLTNHYQSGALLIVRSNSEEGLSRYSGLAAMAGLSLPSSGEDKAAQAMGLIKSRKFVKHLLTFENILPSMMAAKSYNSESQELLFDQELYDSGTKTWKKKPIPSYIKTHKTYMAMVSVSQNTKTHFISINVEHISPVFAKDLLDLIIRESNELLRKKDMEESKQGLEYLTAELSKTPFIEIKESINSLIEAQLETQMMSQINEDYVLIQIEPPFIPEVKSWPSRSSICILSTILGVILSVLIVLIRHYSFAEEEQAAV